VCLAPTPLVHPTAASCDLIATNHSAAARRDGGGGGGMIV
jgi:hypothetical protein